MKKYGLILMAFGLIACAQQSNKAEQEYSGLKKEVFGLHDSLMDEMMQANSLRMKLKTKKEQRKVGDTIEYHRAKEHLLHARKSMMGWMHDFGKAFPDINKQDTTYTDRQYRERTARLKSQQKQLFKVRDAMDNSVKEAKSLLKEKP